MNATPVRLLRVRRPVRHGRIRAITMIVLAAMAGGLLAHRALSSSKPMGILPRPQTRTEPPAPSAADTDKLVVCFGYADLEDGVTTLHPSQVGRVAEVTVRENDNVSAGAVLLRLDDTTARYKVDEAKAVLDEAVARLARAEEAPEQHRLEIAEQKAKRNAARFRLASAEHTLASRRTQMKVESIGRKREDPVTAEEVASTAERIKEFEEIVNQEESKLKALEAQDPSADVARVRAEVATMRARLHEAEHVLEEHVLRAPQAGKVLRIFVSPGELLTTPPKKMAIQFCPDKPRIIRAEVDQAFASRVAVGLPATVEDDGTSGPVWHGHVMRISDWYTQRRQVADEQLQLKDVRTLECLLALDPDQRPLRIGQRVRVTINRSRP